MGLTSPGCLVTLWSVLEKYAQIFVECETHLKGVEDQLMHAQASFSTDGYKFNPQATISKDGMIEIAYVLARVSVECERLELVDQMEMAESIMDNVKVGSMCERVKNEIRVLRESIQSALSRRVFFYADPVAASYYENEDLFGEEVAQKFSRAVPDIKEAGSCYALNRPTACVFHLMRVVPYGMEAVAKLLRVKFARSIDSMEWNAIIEPIDKAVRALQFTPKSTKKFKDQKFYSEVVQHLYFCKDAWRNHVSHGRDPYDMPTARSVMDHVGHLMRLLATRVR